MRRKGGWTCKNSLNVGDQGACCSTNLLGVAATNSLRIALVTINNWHLEKKNISSEEKNKYKKSWSTLF